MYSCRRKRFVLAIRHRSSLTWAILMLQASVILAGPAAVAASFDCAKAATPVERMICSDGRLSRLDETVATEYRAARANAGGQDDPSARDQQRRWLKERNKCRETSCVQSSYEMRLRALLNLDDDTGIQDIRATCAMARCESSVASGPDEELWNATIAADGAAADAALAKGASANMCGPSVARPLHIATGQKNAALVRLLLAAKANPNVRDCSGNSPLVLAVNANDVEIAALLIDAGADVELGGGVTPLEMAASQGHVEALRLLLARGADPNYAPTGTTSLMLGARSQHVEAVDLLLRAGANPNWKTDFGNSALFTAVGAFRMRPMDAPTQERALKIVKLLVQRGANINDRTAGQSSLQRAQAIDAHGISEFLIASGARD